MSNKSGTSTKAAVINVSVIAWPDEYLNVETGDYLTDITKISKYLTGIPRQTYERVLKKHINFTSIIMITTSNTSLHNLMLAFIM